MNHRTVLAAVMLLLLTAIAAATVGAPPAASAAATVTVVPYGSTWSYLDDGSDQGQVWRNPGFDDGLWSSGAGQFGYGDGDETTVLSYGSNRWRKYATTYFRKEVN